MSVFSLSFLFFRTKKKVLKDFNQIGHFLLFFLIDLYVFSFLLENQILNMI